MRAIALERDIGIVLVSRKFDEVLGVCDEATVLAGGRVVHRAAGGNIQKQGIVAAIVGDAHHRPSEAAHQRAEVGEVLLRAEGVAGQRLKGVTLEARRGEIIGLYGLVSSRCSRAA